jgi:hypothetical protein
MVPTPSISDLPLPPKKEKEPCEKLNKKITNLFTPRKYMHQKETSDLIPTGIFHAAT